MSRNTEQKEIILRAFKKGYAPTADELLQKLRKNYPNFSRATLYRNLSAFCDEGDLKKVSILGHTDRYELNTDCNYHLACEICGKLVDLDMDGAIQAPETLMGYEITHHELMFYGICPKCQKELEEQEEYEEEYDEDEEYEDESDEEYDDEEYDENEEDEEYEDDEEYEEEDDE